MIFYFAQPYGRLSAAACESAIIAAEEAVAWLQVRGLYIYAPVPYGHRLAQTMEGCQLSEAYWLDHGLRMLARCDGLIIFRSPGWGESRGVAQEMERARELGMPLIPLAYDGSKLLLEECLHACRKAAASRGWVTPTPPRELANAC